MANYTRQTVIDVLENTHGLQDCTSIRDIVPISIKSDEKGYICDPFKTHLKIGWGATEEEAILHCIERNKVK